MDISRRHVLLGGLSVAFLSGCTAASTTSTGSTAPSTHPDTPSPSTAVASPAPVGQAPLPGATVWQPHAGEVRPAVKSVATRLVEAAATWSSGGLAAARTRLEAAGYDPALATSLAAVIGNEPAATARIVDAQYGGILASTASVLVVVDQWRRSADGTVRPGGTTFDIRLRAASPRWEVTEVLPAKPLAKVSALSATATSVLADDRIRLPYAARADVAAGSVSDTTLSTLRALAAEHVVDVSVMRSGHPYYVFGTGRRSDHTRGHAVDVWALDSRALVQPTNHLLATSAMRQAVAYGAYNVGGPVLLSGSEYFSDQTHQDHIHLGFRT